MYWHRPICFNEHILVGQCGLCCCGCYYYLGPMCDYSNHVGLGAEYVDSNLKSTNYGRHIPVEYAYSTNDLWLLRRRYCHIPDSRLHKYCVLRQAQNRNWVFRALHKYACIVYMDSKATRGVHCGKIGADESRDEVYGADVRGPFATASILGNNFMFCIIDYACK